MVILAVENGCATDGHGFCWEKRLCRIILGAVPAYLQKHLLMHGI